MSFFRGAFINCLTFVQLEIIKLIKLLRNFKKLFSIFCISSLLIFKCSLKGFSYLIETKTLRLHLSQRNFASESTNRVQTLVNVSFQKRNTCVYFCCLLSEKDKPAWNVEDHFECIIRCSFLHEKEKQCTIENNFTIFQWFEQVSKILEKTL